MGANVVTASQPLISLGANGVGTSQVESLTSYVARLAEAYQVTPKEFVLEAMLSALGWAGTPPNSDMQNFWKRTSSSLNGVTSVASKWVDTLQAMTSCATLRYTTMLTWSNVLAVHGLLRPSKAWCPQCYEERRQAGKVVYEPLLWALTGVEICSQHQRHLVSTCPYCQKPLPFLAQGSRPGYCSRCAGWLGSALSEDGESVSLGTPKEYTRQKWIAEVVGELLEAAPKLPISPPKSQIATMMKHCVEQYTLGNTSSFGRLLGITVTLPWQYIQLGQVPSFNIFLQICSTLAIKPWEFLTASALTAPSPLHMMMSQLPKVSYSERKLMTREDLECLRQALETILAQDFQFPLNLVYVAQRLGCSLSTIRRHCPAQYQALAMRYKPVYATNTSHDRLQEALERALESDEVKPLESIAEELRCTTKVLRKYFPDLSQAVVRRVRNRIDHTRIQHCLQEVLASSAPVPSLNDLARQLGYNPSTIRRAFPGLCQQARARRRAEQKHQYENRMILICAKVRQVMETLHREGTYPSAYKVANLLGDPHIIRQEKLRDTWRGMLEELGYREKRLG